jgi:formate-dependent nitrite reductase membrane component NrfD
MNMKTHRFDAVSFIAGLAFAFLGLLFLVPETPQQLIDVLLNSGAWFWPIALLVVGLAVIIPVLLPKRDEAIESGDSD